MTPAEHIAEAERLLKRADHQSVAGLPNVQGHLLRLAQVHALIALAVESGVPHDAAPAVGGTGGS